MRTRRTAVAVVLLAAWFSWGAWLSRNLAMLTSGYTPSTFSQVSETWYQNHGLRVVLLYFACGATCLWMLVRAWTHRARPAAGWKATVRALAVACALLAGAEWIARVYDDIPVGEFTRDPLLGWALARDGPGHNSLGLRGEEVPVEPAADEVRILCVGDSCTYGWGVDPERVYPARLQRHLAERLPGRRVTVINGGVPGYNSAHGLLQLSRLLWLRPSLVVCAFDHNDRPLSTRTADDILRRLSAPPRALRASHLVGFLRTEVLHWCGTGATSEPVEAHEKHIGLDFYERMLGAAQRLCSDAGAQLVVLVLPDNQGGTPGDSSVGGNRNRVLAARSLGLPVLNLVPTYRERADLATHFQVDGYHMTAAGCDHAAELLAAWLLRRGLVR